MLQRPYRSPEVLRKNAALKKAAEEKQAEAYAEDQERNVLKRIDKAVSEAIEAERQKAKEAKVEGV